MGSSDWDINIKAVAGGPEGKKREDAKEVFLRVVLLSGPKGDSGIPGPSAGPGAPGLKGSMGEMGFPGALECLAKKPQHTTFMIKKPLISSEITPLL